MSDGNNFILGQDNSADSSTRLRRISHDDLTAPRPAGERRPGDLVPASAPDQVALYVEFAGDSLLAVSFFGTAVEGQNPGDEGGIGVLGTSRIGPGILGRSSIGPGVRGTSEGKIDPPSNFASDSFGVDGVGRNGATGVRGMTAGVNPSTGMGGIAVHGIAVEGIPTSAAGLFEGLVLVQGSFVTSGPALVTETLRAGAIEAPSKMFRIDHPLDPANKYLIHTVVESPDMKNVYDGLVTLDKQGEATVELPEWFEALNRDLRYQLTPIGAPEPNLHIAEEVLNNRFKIGGGVAGTKVSWQVTGIRKDHWAEAHRNPVEQEKLPEERGFYLHPELYGEGEERALIPGHLHSRMQTTEHRQQVEELNRWIEADGAEVEALISEQNQRMQEQPPRDT